MTSRLAIVDVEWRVDEPFARVIRDGQQPSTVEALLGMGLAYRAGPGSRRICLGRRDVSERGSTRVDCLQPPAPGQRTCIRCAASETAFAANLHHAHTRGAEGIDARFRAHLAKPTVLYLAAFGDGSMKVGTSTASRVGSRLSEQGAWTARLVAAVADGYLVRELEDLVTAETGLAQSVSAGRKLEAMLRPMPESTLEEELDRTAGVVRDLLGPIEAMREGLRRTDEMWTNPRARSEWWTGIHRYPLNLASGRHDLEVMDTCGRLVAVTRPGSGDVFVADLSALFGVELELGEFGSDEIAVQDSLF